MISVINWVIVMLTITILTGLYKPWVVLWWMDHINRLKVIQYYGIALLVFIAIKVLLPLI